MYVMYHCNSNYIYPTAPYSPVGDVSVLFPGTWYLTQVDDKHRRQYSFTDGSKTNGAAESPTAEPVRQINALMYPYGLL